jgi:transposase
MGRIKSVKLDREQRAALEKGYREGGGHAFRVRCQMILLKSDGLSSARVAEIVGCCAVVVNNWLRRYETQGLSGLHTQSGRGRRAILDASTDLEAVRLAVANNRQRIGVAKAELENVLGKSFSQRTLRRFVKKTVVALNGCENVPANSQKRSFTGTKSNV